VVDHSLAIVEAWREVESAKPTCFKVRESESKAGGNLVYFYVSLYSGVSEVIGLMLWTDDV
jgi:hypothetical protein